MGFQIVSATPCIAVTFLTHFFLLAAFMWMLCEGITLYFNVVDVFGNHRTFKVLRPFLGWGKKANSKLNLFAGLIKKLSVQSVLLLL